MTYVEAIEEIRKMPLGEPSLIRNRVKKFHDQVLIDKICAKWWYIVTKDIGYTKEPVAPQAYITMKAHLDAKDEGWKNFWTMPDVQLYVETKRDVNMKNLNMYKNIMWALSVMDDSEVKAIEALKKKGQDFINGRNREPERPLAGFDFHNSEAKMRKDTGGFQRGDN
jgi:hypothetical protein